MANNIKIQKTIRSRYVYLFKNILMHMSLKKASFSNTFPTLDGSDFSSTHRGDLDTSLHEKKKVFGSGKGIALSGIYEKF